MRRLESSRTLAAPRDQGPSDFFHLAEREVSLIQVFRAFTHAESDPAFWIQRLAHNEHVALADAAGDDSSGLRPVPTLCICALRHWPIEPKGIAVYGVNARLAVDGTANYATPGQEAKS